MNPDYDPWLVKLGVSEQSFETAATESAVGPEPPPEPASDSDSADAAASAPDSADSAASGATLVIDNFSFGKTEVPSSHLSELKQLRARLAAAPEATVRLVGHTDTVGKEQFNLKLGKARATAVRAILSGKGGISADQIKVESKGEMQPARGEPPAKLDPDKGVKDAKNRRVEIYVTWPASKPSPVPGVEPSPTQEPGPSTEPPKDGGSGSDKAVRGGLTFEYEWQSEEFGKWGQARLIKGGFKIKVKFKGELIPKGSGPAMTGGYTMNKGFKGEIEIGKQKGIEIAKSIKLKEVKETLNHEFSAKKLDFSIQIKATFESSVDWVAPVVTGTFTGVGLEWEKIKKNPDDVSFAALELKGGGLFKKTFELTEKWNVNLSVEVTIAGSAKPNWPVIIAELAKDSAETAAETAGETAAETAGETAAETVGETAAETAGETVAETVAETAAEGLAGAVTFEALIAAGGLVLSVGIIAGTIKTLVDASEVGELGTKVNQAADAFALGFAAGATGGKPPSDVLAKPGYELGLQSFEEAKKSVLQELPDATDEQIHDCIKDLLTGKWQALRQVMRPYAQQAVWDAFGAAHSGFYYRNIDAKTLEWGYVSIYGRSPSESDPNYTKYSKSEK